MSTSGGIYRPLLGWALRHRVLTLGAAVLVMAGTVALIPRIGKEFMPPLNEGDLMFMPITDPAILPPIAAAAAQSLPDVAVILNASRLLRSTRVPM